MSVLGNFLLETARLLAGQAQLLGIAIVVLVAWLMVRLYSGRKQLSYSEQFNSKIGIVPFAGNHSTSEVLAAFNNITVVLIKIRNSGRAVIGPDDYLEQMQFVSTDSYIVDFRASKPIPRSLFTQQDTSIDGHWAVSRARTDDAAVPDLLRPELRRMLPDSLYAEANGGPDQAARDARRQLQLPKVKLRPGDGFDLVVCLRSDNNNRDNTRNYTFTVELKPGKVINKNRPPRRPSATQMLVAAVAALSVLLAMSLLVWSQAQPYCATGGLRIVGSSAFAPMVKVLTDSYRNDCTGAEFTIATSGSLEGARELVQATADERTQLLAFSDGAAVGVPTEQLHRRAVAVVIYTVVINRAAGVDNLSIAQIQQINSGQLRNWAQLGGADIPIHVVARGSDSGSRHAFEKYLLNGPQAPVSSNTCTEPDRVPTAPVTLCERQTTTEVLQQVDRTPGALGYADASPAAGFANIVRARVDNSEPTAEYVQRQTYPFWTVESAYTNGIPAEGKLLDSFLGYLSSDPAARRLREAFYIPCVRSDGTTDNLCQKYR